MPVLISSRLLYAKVLQYESDPILLCLDLISCLQCDQVVQWTEYVWVQLCQVVIEEVSGEEGSVSVVALGRVASYILLHTVTGGWRVQ